MFIVYMFLSLHLLSAFVGVTALLCTSASWNYTQRASNRLPD